MAIDATGTPSSPDNIPTYNTGADAPSGKGLNNIVAQIQALLTQLKAGTMASGKIAPAGITPGTNGQFLQTTGGATVWGAGPTNTVWQFAPATIFSGAGYVANTLTSVFSQSIPGGTLGSTKRLRVIAFGDYLNNSGAGTVPRFQVLWGGSVIYDQSGSSFASATVRRPWRIQFDLAASTDTGHQSMSGTIAAQTANSGPTAGEGLTDGLGWLIASAGPVAVDSTASQTLEVKVAFSTSNANIDFKLWHAMIVVEG